MVSSDDEGSSASDAPQRKTGLSSDSEDDQPAAKPSEDTEMAEGGGEEKASEDTEMKDKEDEEERPQAASGATRRVVQDSDSDDDGGEPKEESKSAERQHTGLSSDSEDEEPEPKKVPDAKKEKTGLSSDSEDDDEGATKKADDGEKPAKPAVTTADIFGDDDSDAEDGETSGKVKAAKVQLNKEGKLEMGEAEDVDVSRVRDGMMEQAAARAEAKHAAQHKVIPVVMPELERPDPKTKLSLVKLSRHFNLQPTVWEDKKVKDDTEETVARWRYKPDSSKQLESNTRIVKWSDGSMTLHVGHEVLQLKEEDMEANMHHLYVKQIPVEDKESGQDLSLIECHGILDTKFLAKPYSKSKLSKNILSKVSKEFGAQVVDKNELFIKKTLDENQERLMLTQKESQRIRNQARSEATGRRRGGGEMTEDFLERDMEGDVGGLVRAMKNKRKMPDDAALRRAKANAGKKRSRDESSDEESSSSSEDDAPPPRRAAAAARSSSSSSSESSDEEAQVVKKKPVQKAQSTLESSDSE